MTEDRAAAAPAKRAGRSIPLRALAIAAAIPIAGFAAMIALRSPAGEDSRYAIVDSRPESTERPVDPLKAELERCRTVTPETVDDRCRVAWEVNRRRFLGESRSLVLPPAQAPAATETQEGR